MKKLFYVLWVLVVHNFRQALREKNEFLLNLGFFVAAALIFPLSIGPEFELLTRIGAGLIWTLTLFASSLSLQRMFTADFEDGTLEALYFASYPLEAFVAAKIITHWILCSLPVLLLVPAVAVCLHLSIFQIGLLILSLSIGTPILSFIGAIAATLTLGIKSNSFLVPLLVLPLYIPVLIFGVNSVEAAFLGLSLKPYLFMLSGLFFLNLPLSILIGAFNLKLNLKSL
ncbi:MAG: heme exporter protein CcmB [Alphaproteobacteria bacterium]|nr:heme exporter protein CcmB [Alphaproteobacteria bacterium]